MTRYGSPPDHDFWSSPPRLWFHDLQKIEGRHIPTKKCRLSMVGAEGEIHNIYSTTVRYDRPPKFHKPTSTLKWTPRKVRSNSGLVSTIQFQVNHLVSPLKTQVGPKVCQTKIRTTSDILSPQALHDGVATRHHLPTHREHLQSGSQWLRDSIDSGCVFCWLWMMLKS